VGLSSSGEKEMHDSKLLSDNEVGSTEIRGQTSVAVQAMKRQNLRANFWTIVGFCVAGLICSVIIQTSYLRMERTSVMLAEAPLS
jgi:CBS-domain-containing membrane protein